MTPQNNTDLSDINARLNIIEASVIWLLENRVNQGWGYTGINYLEDRSFKGTLPAYVTPSLNATLVLSQILEEIKVVKPSFQLVNRMEDAINETINWLCEIQNADGGFGVKRGEKSRVGNTARAIVVLCLVIVPSQIEKKVRLALEKSIKWLLSNYNPKKIQFEDVSEDFSQFIIETADGNPNAYKRSIIHESFLEPLVIDALRLYHKKCLCRAVVTKQKSLFLKNRIYSLIKIACEEMLNRQKTSGEQQGAVKSRRPAPNEWYTMYTCSDLICSLVPFIEDHELFECVTKSTLRKWILFVIYIVCILVLLLPAFLNNDSRWLVLLLLVLNPIAGNLLSSLVEKFLIGETH